MAKCFRYVFIAISKCLSVSGLAIFLVSRYVTKFAESALFAIFAGAMYSFTCDYTEGAHPEILKRLAETNLQQEPGYGEDSFCDI